MDRVGGRRWVGWVVNAVFVCAPLWSVGEALAQAWPAWQFFVPKRGADVVTDPFRPVLPGAWEYVARRQSFLWPDLEVDWRAGRSEGSDRVTTHYTAGPLFLAPVAVLASWIGVTVWRTRRADARARAANALSGWETEPIPPVRS